MWDATASGPLTTAAVVPRGDRQDAVDARVLNWRFVVPSEPSGALLPGFRS
jgi:hypothetical protein